MPRGSPPSSARRGSWSSSTSGLTASAPVPANSFGTRSSFCSSTAYRDAVLADAPSRYYRLGEASGGTADDATTTSTTRNGTYPQQPDPRRPRGPGVRPEHRRAVQRQHRPGDDVGPPDQPPDLLDRARVQGHHRRRPDRRFRRRHHRHQQSLRPPHLPVGQRAGRLRHSHQCHQHRRQPGHLPRRRVAPCRRHDRPRRHAPLRRRRAPSIEPQHRFGELQRLLAHRLRQPERLGTHDPSRYHFIGDIDEVAIYPTQLSASRVFAHYVAAGS